MTMHLGRTSTTKSDYSQFVIDVSFSAEFGKRCHLLIG